MKAEKIREIISSKGIDTPVVMPTIEQVDTIFKSNPKKYMPYAVYIVDNAEKAEEPDEDVIEYLQRFIKKQQ